MVRSTKAQRTARKPVRGKSKVQATEARNHAEPLEFVVRNARQRDLDAVNDLDVLVTRINKRPHWHDLFERGLGLRQSGQYFLVATSSGRDERLLGFIVGEVRAWEFGSEPCGWVYAMAVESHAREHGVGERLLGALEAQFRRAGVTKMRTMVEVDNPSPMMFFRAEGMMAGPYIQLEKDLT